MSLAFRQRRPDSGLGNIRSSPSDPRRNVDWVLMLVVAAQATIGCFIIFSASRTKQPDPFGPRNADIVSAAIHRCDVVICAWGAYPPARQHASSILNTVRAHRPATYCFGKTKAGAPKHPLYIKSGTPLEVFN
jgi:hypothetical protein